MRLPIAFADISRIQHHAPFRTETAGKIGLHPIGAVVAAAAQPIGFGKRHRAERARRRMVFIACGNVQALLVEIMVVPISDTVAAQFGVGIMVSAEIFFTRHRRAVAQAVCPLRQAVSRFLPSFAVDFDKTRVGGIVHIVRGLVLQRDIGLPAFGLADGSQISAGNVLHFGRQIRQGVFQLGFGGAVLPVFKQHHAQVKTRIGQIGMPPDNAAIQRDCFLMAQLGAAQRAQRIIVKRLVACGQIAVTRQQRRQSLPVVAENRMIDLRFQTVLRRKAV